MNNSQFDNKYSNGVVGIIGSIIRMFERVFIVFFDGLRSATVHGTPSIVGFFAALSPMIAPMAMAAMSAINLQKHFQLLSWQSWLLAISLEVVGFPLWVFVTESIFVDGWKGTTRQYWLAGSVTVYELVILTVNAILTANNFADLMILAFLCLLPALCGVAFSYSNRKNDAVIKQEQDEMKEAQLRAESMEFKLKKSAMKQGLYNPYGQPMATLNQDVPQVKLPSKGDWRNLTADERHEVIHVLSVTDITNKYGVSRSTAFAWKKNSD